MAGLLAQAVQLSQCVAWGVLALMDIPDPGQLMWEKSEVLEGCTKQQVLRAGFSLHVVWPLCFLKCIHDGILRTAVTMNAR